MDALGWLRDAACVVLGAVRGGVGWGGEGEREGGKGRERGREGREGREGGREGKGDKEGGKGRERGREGRWPAAARL